MRLGLIGYPLEHSFSPEYFQKKFEREGLEGYEYKAYPIRDLDLLDEIINEGVAGLNVTIPYKEKIIPYLDILSEEAYRIGAVNTIKVKDGRLFGYNTDIYGFEQSLKSFLEYSLPDKALILGNGGAAKAVKYALENMKIPYKTVSRRPSKNKGIISYASLDKKIMDRSHLIINTTPLGMYPDVKSSPDIPYQYLSEKHFLYDLVYNPKKTLFLANGLEKGCKVKNGYEMLLLQAEKSWKIWNQ